MPKKYNDKTHYRLDFDLDSNDQTNHSGAGTNYGGDALVYISLMPLESRNRKWDTYVKTFSDIGKKANLKTSNLKIEENKINLTVQSAHFESEGSFSLYVMTYDDGKFFDEMPNGKDVKITLPK